MRRTCKLALSLLCISVINYYCLIFFIKSKKQVEYLSDRTNDLDLIHFRSLYPSLLQENKEEELTLKKQNAIGICVNFNFDPDMNGNTLASILPFYTIINYYVVILTPSPFRKLSDRNRQLFHQYNVTPITINHHTSNYNYSLFSNERLSTSGVYHMECIDARSGQLQHKCLLLCAQFYALLKVQHPSLRGILYTADDLYFNFAYVFSHPERFPLDEVWTTPWMQVLDIITGDKGRLGKTWSWWKNKPHLWASFREIFLSTSNRSSHYRHIFETLYGPNKRLAVGIADLLYLPFADNQLATFISVTNELMTLLPSDIFCEIIFSLIVDTTMALCGHWPFENDQPIYNSSINRLNNLSTIQQMESANLIKSARDPFSSNNTFRQRPCLFNPDGYIWDHHRRNRQLFQTAIINDTVPMVYLSKPWPYKTEFVHPMKLSDASQWSSHLWHQGMKQQIEQLQKYQNNQRKVS